MLRRALISPGWPLRLLLVGFPLWWVLGLNTLIFPIMAVPMLVDLRRRRPLKLPPAFTLWALFLVWLVLSAVVMFNASPPGTHAGSLSGRLMSAGLNLVLYAGITVALLYVGNLPVTEVSQQAIARWMGCFFLTVLAGGFLGLVAPRLQFRSVLEYGLPHHIAANAWVKSMVHPVAAQVQDVLGDPKGRPSAPFGYTNSWGNTISIVLVWFVVAWVLPARGRRKIVYGVLALASLAPIVLSLNRGLWLGLIVTAAWLIARQVARGRIGALLAALLAMVIGVVIVAASPLGSVIDQRLQHGDSNGIRTFVAQQSISAAELSPIIGYGGTRHTNGSDSSIAVGPTANCGNCGSVPTGSTGQLWAIMFNQGYGGVVLYFGFFAAVLWVYRRERGPIAEAALVTIALTFVYMWFYSTVPVAPTLTMIAIGVLWRGRREGWDHKLGRQRLEARHRAG